MNYVMVLEKQLHIYSHSRGPEFDPRQPHQNKPAETGHLQAWKFLPALLFCHGS